ncbi:MAG: hypothetical protein NVS2B16_06980 [Chloroflexota bacterium]
MTNVVVDAQSPDPKVGRNGMPPHTRYALMAALGDTAVFALFVLGGHRAHHDSAGGVVEVLGVVLPFLLGWFAAAIALGAYRGDVLTEFRPAVVRVALAWCVGCVIALFIRSVMEQHVVPASFVVVAFVFNLVLLLLWRSTVVAVVRWRTSSRRSCH